MCMGLQGASDPAVHTVSTFSRPVHVAIESGVAAATTLFPLHSRTDGRRGATVSRAVRIAGAPAVAGGLADLASALSRRRLALREELTAAARSAGSGSLPAYHQLVPCCARLSTATTLC